MALRTVADLPALYLDEADKDGASLAESLFEISHMSSNGNYTTYTSKYIKTRELSSMILDGVANQPFDFYEYKTFHGGVGISNVLSLSGNLSVNADVPSSEWQKYHVVINAGDINFNALTTNLCSETLCAFIDNGTLYDYLGDTPILDWDKDNFNVYVRFNAENISCENLTVDQRATFGGDTIFNGNATFTNVINGCALCAKWADLAELYRADADYPPGTLVMFGGEGEAEITVASDGRANAVVTDRPGLVLNGGDKGVGFYKGIALVGRTPVRVHGPVRKSDRLALDPDRPGVAKALPSWSDLPAVAVALSSQDGGDGLVECAVQLRL